MKEYEQAVAWVHSLPPFSDRPGLERVTKLLALLGDPHKQLRFIHIAGTNGKGSVTAMCASILQSAGYRVGMNISPFVIDFRERFQVNGKMISEEEFVEQYRRVRPCYESLLQSGVRMNEFDFITAFAFLYFEQAGCDIVCLEVGLGGLYDATNVIPPPEAAVLMKIAYDHIAVLGGTLEKIAAEKAGIIKRGSVCVCYPDQQEEALAVVMEQCAREGVSLVQPNQSGIKIVRLGLEGSTFRYNDEEFTVSLAGKHQVFNAVTAIETVRQLSNFKVTTQNICDGLKNVRFPVRFEMLSHQPLVILDGAHNQNGVAALAELVGMLAPSPRIGVAGMLADKDYDAQMRQLDGVFDALVLTGVHSERAETLEQLAAAAGKNSYTVYRQPDQAKAFEQAVRLAGENGSVVVFGSLFLASDLRKIILEKNV